jgi:hypothetical protein
MMRSHTTTPSDQYWCSMEMSSVEIVAAAAEIVVLTAMAAEIEE